MVAELSTPTLTRHDMRMRGRCNHVVAGECHARTRRRVPKGTRREAEVRARSINPVSVVGRPHPSWAPRDHLCRAPALASRTNRDVVAVVHRPTVTRVRAPSRRLLRNTLRFHLLTMCISLVLGLIRLSVRKEIGQKWVRQRDQALSWVREVDFMPSTRTTNICAYAY